MGMLGSAGQSAMNMDWGLRALGEKIGGARQEMQEKQKEYAKNQAKPLILQNYMKITDQAAKDKYKQAILAGDYGVTLDDFSTVDDQNMKTATFNREQATAERQDLERELGNQYAAANEFEKQAIRAKNPSMTTMFNRIDAEATQSAITQRAAEEKAQTEDAIAASVLGIDASQVESLYTAYPGAKVVAQRLEQLSSLPQTPAVAEARVKLENELVGYMDAASKDARDLISASARGQSGGSVPEAGSVTTADMMEVNKQYNILKDRNPPLARAIKDKLGNISNNSDASAYLAGKVKTKRDAYKAQGIVAPSSDQILQEVINEELNIDEARIRQMNTVKG